MSNFDWVRPEPVSVQIDLAVIVYGLPYEQIIRDVFGYIIRGDFDDRGVCFLNADDLIARYGYPSYPLRN